MQKTPLLCYAFRYGVKRNVYNADLKQPEMSDGLQRWSVKWFQALEPATEKSAVMSWYVQLMAGSRSETLTTGNIWRQGAAISQLLWGPRGLVNTCFWIAHICQWLQCWRCGLMTLSVVTVMVETRDCPHWSVTTVWRAAVACQVCVKAVPNLADGILGPLLLLWQHLQGAHGQFNFVLALYGY